MRIRQAATPAALVAALLIAGPAFAQQPAPPRPVPDSVRSLIEEAQQIQQRLAQIQDRALEANPELKRERDSVQSRIETAMREEDPELDRRLERLEELRSEFVQAREADDIERGRSLLLEARRIQRRVRETRATVVEREPIARHMRAFEERMLEAMRDVDPETDALMARLDEIGSQLGDASPAD